MPTDLASALREVDRLRQLAALANAQCGYYKSQARAEAAEKDRAALQLSQVEEARARAEQQLAEQQGELEAARVQLQSMQELCGELAGDSSDSGQGTSTPYTDLRHFLNARRAQQPTARYGVPDTRQLQAIAAKPPQFDGKVGQINVRDWLCGLREYIMLVAGSCAPGLQVQLAGTFLKGMALRVWQTERAQFTTQVLTWETFEQVLLNRFDAGMDAGTARYQLDALNLSTDSQGNVIEHVNAFDMLLSYLPDMTEDEKVHRFLASLPVSVRDKLHLDPTTNLRWARYVQLRQYALRKYAHQVQVAVKRPAKPPCAAGNAGQLQTAAGSRGWHPGNKKRARNGDRPSDRGRQGGQRGGQQQGGQPGNTEQRRPRDVKNFCAQRNLCWRCYGEGHRQAECDREWARGNPPGYQRAATAGR
jgi:hypothetical protein